jgi:hypothetical protein
MITLGKYHGFGPSPAGHINQLAIGFCILDRPFIGAEPGEAMATTLSITKTFPKPTCTSSASIDLTSLWIIETTEHFQTVMERLRH